MSSVLLLIGVTASIFVGFNIGGSSTGVAWGPSVGAGLIRKTTAATLTTGLVFLGGWTIGRNVLDTLAKDIVTITIPLEAGIAVLFFIGLGILASNLLSVTVSTSITTVGAIAGLGLATETLNFRTIGWLAVWWITSVFIGFFVGLVVGRYLYPELNRRFRIESSEGPLLQVDHEGVLPTVRLGPGTTVGELTGTVFVLGVSCYMAFSAGASNVPNAVAPLVSSGALGTDTAIIIAALAIGIGAFTIARRTMESVGTELTDISLFAAMIVMFIAASITTVLSYMGIPMSLAVTTVTTITGLGWGRASRPISYRDAVRGSLRGQTSRKVAMDALTVDQEPPVAKIGERESKRVLTEAKSLFNRQALARYISMWIVSLVLATLLSYGYFLVVPL